MLPTPLAFGTSGWRGTLGDDFTFFNLRRAARAVARAARQENRGRAPRLFVGYDTRFLAEQFAREVASVLLSEGVTPHLSSSFSPTPVVAHAVRHSRLDGAITLTAGSDEFERQGFRVVLGDGTPATPEMAARIEDLIRETGDGSAPAVARAPALRRADPSASYLARVHRMLDGRAFARRRLRLVFDPRHGAAGDYLPALLSRTTRITTIHGGRDVRFGGAGAGCGEENLSELKAEVRRTRAHLGLAVSGDATRFGIVDRGGRFSPPSQVLALLAHYLLETRRPGAGIARTAAGTRLLDDVAALHGVPLREVGTGLEGLREPLRRRAVFLAADEDAGFILAEHLPERDGILAACLAAEMVARRGKPLAEMIRSLFAKVGPRHYGRREFRLDASRAGEAARRLESPPASLAGVKVVEARTREGTLLVREDRSWILLRLSRSEALVHAYAEARSPRALARLLDAGRSLTLVP